MSRNGSMDINIIYKEVNKRETTKNMKIVAFGNWDCMWGKA